MADAIGKGGPNMPSIHGTLNVGAFVETSDYEKLYNLPQINDVTVIGNKPLDAYGIQPTVDYADSSDIDHFFN